MGLELHLAQCVYVHSSTAPENKNDGVKELVSGCLYTEPAERDLHTCTCREATPGVLPLTVAKTARGDPIVPAPSNTPAINKACTR